MSDKQKIPTVQQHVIADIKRGDAERLMCNKPDLCEGHDPYCITSQCTDWYECHATGKGFCAS